MEKISLLNNNRRPQAALSKAADRSDFSNTLIKVLIFLIIAVAVMLARALIFNEVDAPRTSIERDIMDNTARLQVNKRDAVAHAGLGAAYIKMGLLKDSLAEFREAVRLKPANAQYRYNLAVAYRDAGATAKALRELDKAKSLTAKWDVPFFTSGRILLDQKKYDKAIKDLKVCLYMNPRNADAHYYLAGAYVAKGNNSEAVAHYREALKFVPDYPGAKAALESLRKK